MHKDSKLQSRLIHAIENQIDAETITALLEEGAVANDAGVMRAFEQRPDDAPEAWVASVASIPKFAAARWLRRETDQAAFDLMGCLEQNKVEGVAAALDVMLAAGDDANMDMCGLSMLALAVTCRCDKAIIELLLNDGAADVSDFSRDAIYELNKIKPSVWKRDVEHLFRISMGKKSP